MLFKILLLNLISNLQQLNSQPTCGRLFPQYQSCLRAAFLFLGPAIGGVFYWLSGVEMPLKEPESWTQLQSIGLALMAIWGGLVTYIIDIRKKIVPFVGLKR